MAPPGSRDWTEPYPAASAATVPPSPARCFRIERAADLLEGPVAEGAPGDYRLDNDRIAVIVDGLGKAAGFSRSGGTIRDVAPTGGRDELRHVFLYLDDTFPREALYSRAVIGHEGGVASLLVRGRDSHDPSLLVETTYSLSPGEPFLRLRTRVRNVGDQAITAYEIGDVVNWGSTAHFGPGLGWELPGQTALPWLAGLGQETTYAYVTASGTPTARHGSSWSDINACAGDLPPGGSLTCDRFLVAAAGGDLGAALAVAYQLRGETVGRVEGRFFDGVTQAPVAGARVWLTPEGAGGTKIGAGKPFAATRTDEQGRFAVPADRKSVV